MEGVGRRSRGPVADADAERFRALHRRHARALTAYCARRLAPDSVDDAVAETFLVAWRRLADVPDGDAGLLWLYRVAHRVVGHEWRGASRRRRLTSRVASRRAPTSELPEDAAIDGDDTRRVLAAAERLNASDAEVLRLLAWEGLAPAEIATVLEINPNAVHQRLHRARRNLLREFESLDAPTSSSPAARSGGER